MRDIIAKELLVFHVEIGKPTVDWQFGKQLLELFAEHDKRLVPQLLSVWNDKVADFTDVEDARPHWAGVGQLRVNGSMSEFHAGLGWRRNLTTKYQAEIKHEHQNVKGRYLPASLSFYAKPHKSVDWRRFAESLYELTDAQYGFMHLYRDAHLRKDLSNAREPTWSVGQRTPASIPQLGWSTFLGRPYAGVVGQFLERNQHADHNVSVVKLGSGIAISLTESIYCVADRFDLFSLKRAKVKSWFPENFFTM